MALIVTDPFANDSILRRLALSLCRLLALGYIDWTVTVESSRATLLAFMER